MIRSIRKFIVRLMVGAIESTEWILGSGVGLIFEIVLIMTISPYLLIINLAHKKTKSPLSSHDRFFLRDLWGNFAPISNSMEIKNKFSMDRNDKKNHCGCVVESPLGRVGISRQTRNGKHTLTLHSFGNESLPLISGLEKRNGKKMCWSDRKTAVLQDTECMYCTKETCPLKHEHFANLESEYAQSS